MVQRSAAELIYSFQKIVHSMASEKTAASVVTMGMDEVETTMAETTSHPEESASTAVQKDEAATEIERSPHHNAPIKDSAQSEDISTERTIAHPDRLVESPPPHSPLPLAKPVLVLPQLPPLAKSDPAKISDEALPACKKPQAAASSSPTKRPTSSAKEPTFVKRAAVGANVRRPVAACGSSLKTKRSQNATLKAGGEVVKAIVVPGKVIYQKMQKVGAAAESSLATTVNVLCTPASGSGTGIAKLHAPPPSSTTATVTSNRKAVAGPNRPLPAKPIKRAMPSTASASATQPKAPISGQQRLKNWQAPVRLNAKDVHATTLQQLFELDNASAGQTDWDGLQALNGMFESRGVSGFGNPFGARDKLFCLARSMVEFQRIVADIDVTKHAGDVDAETAGMWTTADLAQLEEASLEFRTALKQIIDDMKRRTDERHSIEIKEHLLTHGSDLMRSLLGREDVRRHLVAPIGKMPRTPPQPPSPSRAIPRSRAPRTKPVAPTIRGPTITPTAGRSTFAKRATVKSAAATRPKTSNLPSDQRERHLFTSSASRKPIVETTTKEHKGVEESAG